MTSETELKNAAPLADDNVEENMEDILNSIRQIMNMDVSPQSSTQSPRPSPKKASAYPDIPHIIDKKKTADVLSQPKKAKDILILKKSAAAPSKPKPSAPTQDKPAMKEPAKPQKKKSISLPDLVHQSLHTAIEKWLAQNLERIVEEVVREEIKRMLNVPKS